MVGVRKMGPGEAAAVVAAARAAKPRAAGLEEAVKVHPDRVRVVTMGRDILGAFVLTEAPGGVEEISSMALLDAGVSAGAERAAVEYVVSAARFARKKAVEVVAEAGSAEARHLEADGLKGAPGPGAQRRFRIEIKR